jgi:hypothetical protein
MLLDLLLNHHDRVENADCLHFCVWVEGGQVRRMPAQGTDLPWTNSLSLRRN